MKTGKICIQFNPLYFLFLFLLILLPDFSFAQVLGKFEFTGVSTIETQNNFSEVTTQPVHATFSPFSRKVVQWWRGDNVYNSREWSKDSTDIRYIEFTIAAKPGHRLQLNKLSFTTNRTATGPTIARVAHNFSNNFDTQFKRYAVTENNQTVEWEFDPIITPLGGAVTFRVYGFGASSYLGAMRVDNVSLFGNTIPEISVNEFHYANTTATKTGFLEVALPKDFVQLNSIMVNLYNKLGEVYGTYPLNLFKAIGNGIFDDQKILYLDLPLGLAEEQGGFSISLGTYVIQFISYGGAITGVSGPAIGLKSRDIVVNEKAEDGASNSVYLTVNNDPRFPAGIWAKGLINTNSKGYPNTEVYSVLPVELVFFRAQSGTKEVNLNWATAIEKDNDLFVVERSWQEASNFEPIGSLKGAGNAQTEKQYKFTDSRPQPGTSYYRLKQIDADGKYTYSSIVAVSRTLTKPDIQVYPNPSTSVLNIDLGDITQGKEIQIQIVNGTGRIIYQNLLPVTEVKRNYSVPVADLPGGTYYLVLTKNGKRESRTFMKI